MHNSHRIPRKITPAAPMIWVVTMAMTMATMLSSTAMGDIWTDVEHGFADSDGVKIHYASVGEGPLVIMIHGFPDFWYSWRHQMDGLKSDFQTVAIDQRGYNLSGQLEGNENYAMSLLVERCRCRHPTFGT